MNQAAYEFYNGVSGARQTGRTTKMLEKAALRKAEGHRILIVVPDAGMITYCMMAARNVDIPGLDARLDFCTAQSAVRHGKFRGLSYPDIFVDHAVWELCGENTLRHLEGELNWMKQTGPKILSEEEFRALIELPDPWCDCELA